MDSNRNAFAKAKISDQRQRANWSRLLVSPIRLPDGSVVFTLKDAAECILKMPPAPSTRVAASQIIEAALQQRDTASIQAALRLALLKRAIGSRAASGDRSSEGIPLSPHS